MTPADNVTNGEAIAIMRAVAWRNHPTFMEADCLFNFPGPLILCCGFWQALTAVPYTCLYCAKQYLKD